jgi:hypothetical protein
MRKVGHAIHPPVRTAFIAPAAASLTARAFDDRRHRQAAAEFRDQRRRGHRYVAIAREARHKHADLGLFEPAEGLRLVLSLGHGISVPAQSRTAESFRVELESAAACQYVRPETMQAKATAI